jgi:GNAT superfamily N-acetyltransferase
MSDGPALRLAPGQGAPVRIRRAEPTDVAAIADIYIRSRHASVPAIPPLVHDDDHVRDWVMTTLSAEASIWLAEAGGHLVAMMAMTDGWLEHLYVAPEATGQRIGTALLSIAKECQPTGLQLWTFQTNVAARRFYEREEFIAVEMTDGRENMERSPDVRYVWDPKEEWQ